MIDMHTLPIDLHIFLVVQIRRICLNIFGDHCLVHARELRRIKNP